MRRVPLAALLRLIIIAGGASFVNPYVSEDRVDLNQVWVEIPSTLVALGGDVHIRVHGASGGGLKVRIAREDDDGRALLATMPLALDTENRMTLPCGYFSRGGTYYLELISEKDPYLPDYDNATDIKRDFDGNKVKRDVSEGSLMETGDSVVKSWKFDVLWPTANLDVTPEQIQTYPERQVMAILDFPRVVCTPIESSADFWLELLYCGHSSGGAVLCDGKNTSSHAHVLYSEQMHGFPGRRTMTLRCELFGQAGDYALTLRPAAAAGPQDLATAFIKADWSEQFVLNVHGGSVFPCGDGVRVLFQYPECVLEGADRVRVFGRDSDRLRYVAERRVRRGQHTASFDCRLFSERYPEYCFVYVSQAVTGAVADVRMDCLPTLPLSADGGAGGWGAWSAWSACPAPAHCSTRTRSRHRFCDSPPPAYGAKFCEAMAKRIRGAITAEQAKITYSEVERAFYELRLADCNRKLARLKQAVHDYEIRNEALQKAYDQLDEDKADVIAYIKKTLNVKCEENAELKEKVRSLEELRVTETAQFKETVDEFERNFTRTKDQLTSEYKILAGKLNTLEEFRAIREDLTKKFERQEHEFEEQEMKYKRIIFDTEKQLIIGKDKLKKEMEERLLQLAQDFQDASEMRIAASTHRVIRENIALNNQLDSLLMTQAKVAEQNEKFREDERASHCAMEVAEKERDKAMNKSIVQLKVIDQLIAAFDDVRKQKKIYDNKQFDTEKMQAKIQRMSKMNEKLSLKVRVLEQNLHAILGDQNKSVVETAKLLRERTKFKNILKESAFAVHAALKMDHWTTLDPSCEILDMGIVLKRILGVLNQYRDAARAESMESLISLSNIYEKGDLGFDVKTVPSRKSQALVEAAGGAKTASLTSFEYKHSGLSVSSPIPSSKESIKTIPSIKLVPVDDDISLPTPKESLASFTVTSLHSSYSASIVESEESGEDLTDVSKLLALSRVELQKSLMQDLVYSQLSSLKLQSGTRLGTDSQKSIISGKGGLDDIEGEHESATVKTMPEEDEIEHGQDKGESTEDTRETVQDKGESTHDTSELVTVEQDDDEDNKKKETSAE